MLWLLLACAPPAPPDVLLIVVDALRADRVSAESRGRPTPNLDALCEGSLVFSHAFAHGVDTRSSMPALLSGLSAHGPWLGERLGEAGYQSAVFTGNAWIQAPLTDGFQRVERVEYSYLGPEEARVDGADLVAAYEAWLKQAPRDTPTLAWLHLMDVHEPLNPPAPWAGRYSSPGNILMFNGRVRREIPPDQLQRLADRYDEAVGWTDTLLGRAIAALDARGRDSVVLLTADHGEALGERGQLGHGGAITPEIAAVPLVLRLPLRQGRRVEAPVGHLDVLPTLLAAAGLPEDLPGVDLRGPIPADRRLPISARALDDGRPLLGEVAWPWLDSAEAAVDLRTGESGPPVPVTPDTSGFRTIHFAEDPSGRMRALGYVR